MEAGIIVTGSLALVSLGWNFWQQTRIKKLEAEYAKSIHVHQAQFDREFDVYREIWKALVKLRVTTYKLRPEGEFIDLNVSVEERKNEKIKNHKEAYKACLDIYEDNKPFYPEEVYQRIDEVLAISRKELIEFRFKNDREAVYWENAKKNYEKILNAIDLVCTSIRVRVGLLELKSDS